MNRRQLFIEACNTNNADLFFNDFSEQESRIGYIVRNYCSYCGKKEINDIYHSYWGAVWIPTHKVCKPLLSSETAYECQKIDANCNDCKFFTATESHKGIGTSWRDGICVNGHDAHAQPNFWQGNKCFEHRKD